MARSPYNLPPPWAPGFDNPTNADAEGLVRGTFVTKQLPRGTYDQPSVGTGGYVVPNYVMDEGYGQGAFNTKWMPRGEAVILPPNWLDQPTSILRSTAPARGGDRYNLEVMSGLGAIDASALPEPGSPGDPIAQYGRVSARQVIARMRKLPAADRVSTLKVVLDTVDPTLWQRVADRSQVYLKAGQSSLSALEQALASSLSEGFAKELIATGKTGKAPEPDSLMGLGCYGCGPVLGNVVEALSDDVMPMATGGQGIAETDRITVGPYIFSAAPQKVPTQEIDFTTGPNEALPNEWGRWFYNEVKRLSAEKIRMSTGIDDASRAAVAQAMAGEPPKPTTIDEMYKYVQHHVGFFGEPYMQFDSPDGRWRLNRAETYGLDRWVGIMGDTPVAEGFFGAVRPSANGNTYTSVAAKYPVMRTTHPVTGKDYGIYYVMSPKVLKVWFREIKPEEKKGIGKLWDKIADIPSWIKRTADQAVDAAKDALQDLGSNACKVLNTKGAEIAGAAVATYYGAPPQVGVKGVEMGRGLCNGPDPTIAPPVPATPPPKAGIGMLPALAIIGGVAGAAYFLTRKHS